MYVTKLLKLDIDIILYNAYIHSFTKYWKFINLFNIKYKLSYLKT